MLKEIKLANFKSYKSEQSIPLKKLTLLFGPNGGGKSSVIQSIAELKGMMGYRDDYLRMYLNLNEKLEPVDNCEFQKKAFHFKDFIYSSFLIKKGYPIHTLLKSEFELIIEKERILDYPISLELREINRFRQGKNGNWVSEEVETNTIFILNRDKNENEYSIDNYDISHPYWFANLKRSQREITEGFLETLLEKQIKWIDLFNKIMGDSIFMRYTLPSLSNNEFSIELNDLDKFNNKLWFWYNSFRDIKKWDKLEKTEDDELMDEVSSSHVIVNFFNEEPHPVVYNFCKPFYPLYRDENDDYTIEKDGWHDVLNYNSSSVLILPNRPLKHFYNTQIIPPVRKVPKRLTAKEIENFESSDLSAYKKLFWDLFAGDMELNKISLNPTTILNTYLILLNSSVILQKVDLSHLMNLDKDTIREKLEREISIGWIFELMFNLARQIHSISLYLKTYGDDQDPFLNNENIVNGIIDFISIISPEVINDKIRTKLSIRDLEEITESANTKTIKAYLKNLSTDNIPQIGELLFSINNTLRNGIDENSEAFRFSGDEQATFLHNEFDSIYSEKEKLVKNEALELLADYHKNEIVRTAFESQEFVLFDKESKHWTRFNETGTGFSQVFPVVINSALHFNRLICIEQPELHLHPGLQANLAPMFIKSIKENNNNFILETHSEHLIKSVQLEVAKYHQSNGEEGISKDDVSLVYISKDKETGESRVKEMRLDKSGSFTEPWPDDFFESSSDLTYERLKLTNKN